jgi:hypothetical protein
MVLSWPSSSLSDRDADTIAVAMERFLRLINTPTRHS